MQDARVCFRSLLRAPVLSLTIVATVGIGIGATTAIFAAVHTMLIRPLPYADPDRLMRIYTDSPPFVFRFSTVDFLALRDQQTQFEGVTAFTDRPMSYTDGENAELLRGRLVAWNYFSVLGITPILGRNFDAGHERPGSPRAVLVSHGFWQQRLGGRVDVIGQPIRLDGNDHTLVGVLPPLLSPLERRQEFFAAIQFTPPPRRGPFPYWVIGRLRDGVSVDAATSELRAINKRIFPIWKSSFQDERATWSVTTLTEFVVGNNKTTAGLALAAVALVWLIACANASSLLVARVTTRRRELAVRAALGATRSRVMRYMLTESALLAGASVAIGAAIGWAGLQLLRSVGVNYFPRMQEIAFDGSVMWTLAALAIMSGAIFGVVPAVHGAGRTLDESLKASGRASTGGPGARRLRRTLVAAQFAIATPLLVVAGMLLASLSELRKVDLGFDARNVLGASVRLPETQYTQESQVVAFWAELKRRLDAVPGVTGVAFADSVPPTGAGNLNNFDLEDLPAGAGRSQPATPFIAVSPEYTRVLGLTLIEGRLLEEADARRQDYPVVMVDQAWARRFFPNQSAIGKRFRSGGCTQCAWTVVVGVVSNVKHLGLDAPDEGTVYTPIGPNPVRFVVARTQTDAAALVSTVRQILRELEPQAPFTSVATIEERTIEALQRPRSLSLLVAGFALVALLLSIVGIYAVMGYFVQQHTKEISIRMALGGRAADVVRLVIGHGMAVVGVGVVAGLIIAFGATRLMSTLLFRVAAADVVIYTAVATGMLAIALLACVIPARRAARLQPAAVLRQD